MNKKIIAGGAAAALILLGAASAAQLDTTGVGTQTLAAGDITVDGAVLEDLSFGTAWSQGFADDANGLITDGGYGSVSVTEGVATINGLTGGPFTRFGGYTTTSAGQWTASVDVYLDPAAPTLFDYSVAANNANGHVQDFVFHAGLPGNTLTIGASSNSSNDATKPNNGITGGYIVPEAGWYTLQHTFGPNTAGELVVDLSVVKDGATVWTKSIQALKGGNPVVFAETGSRYGWFTFTTGDLKIDNLIRTGAGLQSQVSAITVDVDKANSYVVASIGTFTSPKVQANGDGVAVIQVPTIDVQDLQGPIHLVVTS